MNRFTLSPRRTTVGGLLAAMALSLVAGCGSSEPEYLRISLPGNVLLELAKKPGGLLFGKTEVTQAQFDALLGKDRDPSLFMGADLPVNNADAQSVEAFLDALNALPETKSAGLRFRLPTESEWREACLAGGTGPFGRLKNGKDGTAEEMANAGIPEAKKPVLDIIRGLPYTPSPELLESDAGKEASRIADRAFHDQIEMETGKKFPLVNGVLFMRAVPADKLTDDMDAAGTPLEPLPDIPDNCPNLALVLSRMRAMCDDAPRPVAAKSPNAWGLYDMHGNVWELTSTKDEDGRVVACGGAWLSAHAEDCGAGARETFDIEPSDDGAVMRCPELGFRVCAERVQ